MIIERISYVAECGLIVILIQIAKAIRRGFVYANIATAKAVKTLHLKHFRSRLEDYRIEQFACGFDFLATTNNVQFY